MLLTGACSMWNSSGTLKGKGLQGKDKGGAASGKDKHKTFNQKEKRKRDAGQSERGKSYVEGTKDAVEYCDLLLAWLSNPFPGVQVRRRRYHAILRSQCSRAVSCCEGFQRRNDCSVSMGQTKKAEPTAARDFRIAYSRRIG